jgi:manganese transport protein
LFAILLLITIFYPLLFKNKHFEESAIHQRHVELNTSFIEDYGRIAIALDFSHMDERIISHGLKQGGLNSNYILIHVVESASAKILGKNAADDESKKDEEQLSLYVAKLEELGRKASFHLGYRNRVEEIARICKEEKADLLILGAHGHSGISDFIYGQTIESVRHLVKIPVLIVS